MDTAEIVEAIDEEILRLQHARNLIAGETEAYADPGERSRAVRPARPGRPAGGKRFISEEGKARIAAAQKARWAKVKR